MRENEASEMGPQSPQDDEFQQNSAIWGPGARKHGLKPT